MKKILSLSLILVLFVGVVSAFAYQDRIRPLLAYDYEAITTSGTSQGLSAAKYNPSDGSQAERAVITAETSQCRYTIDGTTPTASIGHILGDGDVLTLTGYRNIRAFRCIEVSTAGSLKVTYER